MKKIKAAFFDVDKTLYTHRIHDFIKSSEICLRKLQENNIKIFVATSRCYSEMQHTPSFFRNFKWDGMVLNGGAEVLMDDQEVQGSPIDNQLVIDLIDYAHRTKIPLRYATARGNFFAEEVSSKINDVFFNLYINYPIIKPYNNERVFNILMFPATVEQRNKIKENFPNISYIEHGLRSFEITHKGIGKHIGVQAICDKLKIAICDVACFGDGENDVEMLKAAGIGICPDNGCDEAKQAADIVCDDMENDGIYKVCLLNGWIQE